MSGVCADVPDRCVADVQHDPIVTAAVAAITREAQQQPLGSEPRRHSFNIQGAVHLFRNYASVTFRKPSGKGRLSLAQVRRLTAYIESRLHEQLNLETLAAVAGVGVWTFTRHFRESLAEPRTLTLSSGASIAPDVCWHRAVCRSREVASVYGFADQAHMTRVFQTHLKTTPPALRL